MFSKGNPHNDGIYLARYLASDSKGNERSELAELKGFASDNIFDAFALGQLMASGTRCEKPFFHSYIRLPAGEALSREQWKNVADRIERQLGFKGQPRAIVFHLKDGNEHMHLVWSRIGKDMKAIDPGLYKNKLKEISRVLEKELGLRQIGNERDPDEKTQSALRPEFEESRRLETNLKDIRETIRECWDISDNGRSFTAALNEKNLIFARGDKRDFVIVDHAGGLHALSKRITGVSMKDVRERLTDIDRENLPDVEQARSEQRERRKNFMPDQKGLDHKKDRLDEEEHQQQASDEITNIISRMAEESQKREAIQKEEDQKQEAIQKEEDRKQQAIKDEEQRKETAVKEEESRRQQFKEQADRQEAQAKEMQLQQQRLDEYRASLERMAEESRRAEAQRAYEAEQAAAAKELFIRDSGMRYGQALAQHYDIRDPYGSLARSAMAEYGSFLRDRENVDHQIARATDPTERKALELQKRIEAAEYMAITSNRIAAQSEIITGRRNSEEAVNQRSRAEAFQKEARELRKEFRDIQKTRLTQEQPGNPPKSTTSHEPEPMVEERVTGQKEWKTQPFSEFVKTAQSRQPEKDVTHEDQKRDTSLRDAYFEGVVFKQRRDSSLEQIREDMKAGRSLDAKDLRNLTRDELQKVRHWGHEHLKTIVQEHTRQRDLDKER